jgi:RNA polymerase sigma-70 factor (ECF subfamily)
MTKDVKLLLADWVNEYTAELFAWANSNVSNTELAENLVRDTFMEAGRRMDEFIDEIDPKNWLYSIINYKIFDYYRKKVKQNHHYDQHSLRNFFNAEGKWYRHKKPLHWPLENNELLNNFEFLAIQKQCIEALPRKWNLGIKFKYLMEKSTAETFQDLELAPSKYLQILHRAKLSLHECIESQWIR